VTLSSVCGFDRPGFSAEQESENAGNLDAALSVYSEMTRRFGVTAEIEFSSGVLCHDLKRSGIFGIDHWAFDLMLQSGLMKL
jgi:hypothetical protein